MTGRDLVRRADLMVLEFDVDGELSLYRSGSEEAVVLNSTASEIWRLTEQEHSLDEVVDAMADTYGVAADAIRADVVATVQSLHAAGLLNASTANGH